MAMQTKCPNCENILKLKSDGAVGRKVPCPKCGTPFTIKLMSTKPKARPKPQPEEEDEYDEYGYEDDAYDDYDYDDGYEDDYDGPPKRSAKSSKSSKKKKAAGTPKWLIGAGIGGGVVLVLALLVGGIGFLISKMGGGGGNVINLAWLPENADMFIYMRPNEIVNAPMLAPVRDSEFIKMAMAQAKAQGSDMPFEAKDIESVTVAGVDMVDMYKQRTALFGARVGQAQLTQRANPKMVSVFRLSRDFSEEDFAGPTREHNGRILFVINNPQGESVLCVIDPRTILAGEASQVTAALDRGASEPRVKRIDFVNADHHLVMVMAPPTVLQATTEKPVTSPADRLENAMNKGAKAGYLAMSVRTDLEMEVGFDSFGSTEAQEIQDTFDAMLTEGKGKFETSVAQVPPQFQEFVAIGRDTMNSINVKRSGNNVVVTGKVPGRIVAAVQDAIASNPLAGMMMQGMMQQMQQQPAPGGTASPGMMSPGAASPGTMPDGSVDPGAAVTPSGSPEDADMEALQAERQQTQGTLDGIRGTIKQTTGNIQQAVPGGQ